ncbi:hypothetical protein MMC09_002998 [Bachmanniomyces sp. S44760]|nr:hypothetical protein [Bachmanniomyces sp. S44760]
MLPVTSEMPSQVDQLDGQLQDTRIRSTSGLLLSTEQSIPLIHPTVKNLIRRRSALSAALLTTPRISKLIQRDNPTFDAQVSRLRSLAKEQSHENQQNLYRMCTGATLFEAHDPNPNAVDNGRIVGVRIEAFSLESKTFLNPYYLLLNRSNPNSPSALTIYKHTIPICIPLTALAERYLPAPMKNDPEEDDDDDEAMDTSKPQNLSRLVRELRREIISYHRRRDSVDNLRKRLVGKKKPMQGRRKGGAKIVEAENAEITDLRFELNNAEEEEEGGRATIGRVKITKGGKIEKVVVQGGDGRRNRVMERRLARAERLEDIEDL